MANSVALVQEGHFTWRRRVDALQVWMGVNGVGALYYTLYTPFIHLYYHICTYVTPVIYVYTTIHTPNTPLNTL